MSSNIIEVFADERVKPSIDKITIIGHSSLDILGDDIFNLVGKYGQAQFQCEEYISSAQTGYKKLYKISYRKFYEHGSYEVYTLALLIGYIACGSCNTYKNQRKFKIEYNPNKFKVPDWLVNYFIKRKYHADEVKNIDLCFDFIGFKKNSFRYVLNNANTKIMAVGTQNNLSDVIGYSDKSANRIKIYDKRKERLPYYDLGQEVARVEITLDWKYYGPSFNTVIGDINTLTKSSKSMEQIFITQPSSDDAFVYALSCLDTEELQNALSLMSRHTRTKYKQLLKENCKYTLCCNTLMMINFLDSAVHSAVYNCGISFKHYFRRY